MKTQNRSSNRSSKQFNRHYARAGLCNAVASYPAHTSTVPANQIDHQRFRLCQVPQRCQRRSTKTRAGAAPRRRGTEAGPTGPEVLITAECPGRETQWHVDRAARKATALDTHQLHQKLRTPGPREFHHRQKQPSNSRDGGLCRLPH